MDPDISDITVHSQSKQEIKFISTFHLHIHPPNIHCSSLNKDARILKLSWTFSFRHFNVVFFFKEMTKMAKGINIVKQEKNQTKQTKKRITKRLHSELFEKPGMQLCSG